VHHQFNVAGAGRIATASALTDMRFASTECSFRPVNSLVRAISELISSYKVNGNALCVSNPSFTQERCFVIRARIPGCLLPS